MTRALISLLLAILGISTAAAQEPLSTKEALIARAKSLELNTPYVPPPGGSVGASYGGVCQGHVLGGSYDGT
jgi:hypothetical protein